MNFESYFLVMLRVTKEESSLLQFVLHMSIETEVKHVIWGVGIYFADKPAVRYGT